MVKPEKMEANTEKRVGKVKRDVALGRPTEVQIERTQFGKSRNVFRLRHTLKMAD